MLQAEQDRKLAVNKFKSLIETKKQWDGFCNYLDILITEQHRRLEKADNLVTVHRAQGAIEALRYLKYLREEVAKN